LAKVDTRWIGGGREEGIGPLEPLCALGAEGFPASFVAERPEVVAEWEADDEFKDDFSEAAGVGERIGGFGGIRGSGIADINLGAGEVFFGEENVAGFEVAKCTIGGGLEVDECAGDGFGEGGEAAGGDFGFGVDDGLSGGGVHIDYKIGPPCRRGADFEDGGEALLAGFGEFLLEFGGGEKSGDGVGGTAFVWAFDDFGGEGGFGGRFLASGEDAPCRVELFNSFERSKCRHAKLQQTCDHCQPLNLTLGGRWR